MVKEAEVEYEVIFDDRRNKPRAVEVSGGITIEREVFDRPPPPRYDDRRGGGYDDRRGGGYDDRRGGYDDRRDRYDDRRRDD